MVVSFGVNLPYSGKLGMIQACFYTGTEKNGFAGIFSRCPDKKTGIGSQIGHTFDCQNDIVRGRVVAVFLR